MSFRSIIIESPAHVSIKSGQLSIRAEQLHTVSPEDISALMLENRQSTITTAALSLLGQCGCAVFVCDERHIPCAVLQPFGQNCRGYGMIKLQVGIGAVRKKQLWQQIVTAKINNQAECLRICGNIDAASGLNAMAQRVTSGDGGNLEAAAAQHYFPALFAPGFSRSTDNGINAALNYGYAILRGSMARYLSVYGLIPAIGLHHHNELNSFNLADDCMEPFRPVVDLLVASLLSAEDELTPERKRLLFNCLNLDIGVNGKVYSVAYAMELMVQSLARSLKEDRALLKLPNLLPMEQHRYE